MSYATAEETIDRKTSKSEKDQSLAFHPVPGFGLSAWKAIFWKTRQEISSHPIAWFSGVGYAGNGSPRHTVIVSCSITASVSRTIAARLEIVVLHEC